MTSIQIDGLQVVRGGNEAVRDASITIEGPGWIGLVGANGSGKTSLLRALAGRLDPTGGRICVDGVDRTADRAWRASFFGFAPWEDLLPDALTGRELIGVLENGESNLWEDAALSELRRALGLDVVAGRRLGDCSSGMRQRIAIGCAFTGGRRTIILDEPFNWLDPVAAFDLRRALRDLVDGGFTLISALQDLPSLLSFCSAGAVLRDGRIVATLSPEDFGSENPRVLEEQILEHLR
ncbi:ATP-binding cassette domain-containing protein [Sphingomonas zeae]